MSGYSYTLYHYWRSSCSWRVRWALEYKKIPCQYVAIDLLQGQQRSEEHLARNPVGYVPVLAVESPDHPTRYICESCAILEFLEEVHPSPSLLPGDVFQRARIRQLVQVINSDTQPLQNMTVQKEHSGDPEERTRWIRLWINKGLHAYETLAKETASSFSVGDELTMADVYLIPQLYNAMRFDIPLTDYPVLHKIHEAAMETASCQAAHPDAYKP
eukprot:gene11448-12802_t